MPPRTRKSTAPAASAPPTETSTTMPDSAPDATPEAAAPAAPTRARRTRKAAAPAAAPASVAGEGDASAPAAADAAAVPAPADVPEAPAPAKAPRARRSRRAVADPAPAEAAPIVTADPLVEAESAVAPGAEGEAAEDEDALELPASPGAEAPAARPAFVLFQAPDPTAARPRRATRAAAAPEPVAEPEEEAPTADAAPEAEDDDSASRRRRRGGRGRRARPESDAAEPSTDSTPAESDAPSAGPGDDADETDEAGGTRRRRRRRRGAAGGEQEDPPGTVTRVRAPRDEVSGVRGSTRLEAKKQRRREGREQGRRRQSITEAEFLARRESVERVMVVRSSATRTQIGVLEDNVLVEHYVANHTADSSATMVGNVYLGRVQNVLPSMEAAFVDIGRGRNAVLYAGEVNWDAAGLEGQAKRIEHALKSGDSVLVQVTKDPIGHKGARLTSQISLPGRYLVYVPNSSMTGISRKLPDTERARLKKVLREVVPSDGGVIVRTAAEGASDAELRSDVERLVSIWDKIQSKATKVSAPALVHGEPPLTVRVIRDVFNEDFAKIVVSGERAWAEVDEYLTEVAPDLRDRAERWASPTELFAHYRVDEALAKALDRKVWLPSGGSLVIDRTEAMTVVDVNTGKFTGSGGNLEETVTRNNLEAAEEIVRQLRLRDLGGIIVVDFIDMVLEANRDLVIRRLLECLGRDRTKHQVAEVTSLGLVQMTRKRVGAGLLETFSTPCTCCNGRGLLVTSTPVESAPEPPPAPEPVGRSKRRREAAKAEATAPAPEKPAAVATEVARAQIAAIASALKPTADMPEPPLEDLSDVLPGIVDEQPAPRTRRKRGRVVSAAGAPGSASISVTEPGGLESPGESR